MIRDRDRSGWFGASDTGRIMGRWDTQTFRLWWMEKLGLRVNNFTTPAMMAGTYYEHRILDALGIRKRDRRIKVYRYRLRVNLDGESDIIHEVKTHSSKEYKFPREHWMQCQVQMFAARKGCEIVAYQMTEEEYKNYFLPIDPGRITRIPVKRDDGWLEEEYLPNLITLRECLKKGVVPDEDKRVGGGSKARGPV